MIHLGLVCDLCVVEKRRVDYPPLFHIFQIIKENFTPACVLQPLFETDDDEYVEGAYNICPDCGCKINFENDGGNGFCVNCAPNH